MNIVLPIFIKIFSMILIGYILSKKNLMTHQHREGFSKLLIHVVLPLNILSCINIDSGSITRKSLLFILIFAICYYCIAIVMMQVITKKLNSGNELRKLIILLAVFANIGFIGFPIIENLLGKEGKVYLITFNLVFILALFAYGELSIMETPHFSFLNFIRNASVIASLLAVVMIFASLKLPDIIASFSEDVGSIMTPLSMFIIGSSLADVDLGEIFTNKYAYIVTLMRQLVFPVFVFIVLYLMRIPSILIEFCVLISALPSGSLVVVLAEKHKKNVGFASQIVAQGTMSMLVTVPLIAGLLKLVL